MLWPKTRTGRWCLPFYVCFMFNSRPQYPPPSLFFPSSLLRLSQPKPELDSCNKSQEGLWSNQHCSWTVWESMWASWYQTCPVMPHNVWWRHHGSDQVSWEWHDLSRLFQCTQRTSIKAARSLRHRPHGIDLQWVVAALNKVPRHILSRQVLDSENGLHLGLGHDCRWL